MVKDVNIEKGTKELIPYFSAKGVMVGLIARIQAKAHIFLKLLEIFRVVTFKRNIDVQGISQ